MRILSLNHFLVLVQRWFSDRQQVDISLLLTLTSDPSGEDKRGLLQRTNHNYVETCLIQHPNLKTPPKFINRHVKTGSAAANTRRTDLPKHGAK